MTELNDEAGPELSREFDFDESEVGAGEVVAWDGTWFGHPDKDARSAENE